MNERMLYENTFNHSAIINRRYRLLALISSLLAGGLLTFYLLQ
jgi:hypothetical protein